MNRKTISILSIGTACILSAGTAAAFSSLQEQRETRARGAAYSRADAAGEPADAYLLREYEGKLAVFERGEEAPSQVFDLDIRLLPPYDQGLLQAGIGAADEKELARLLEDYTS